MADEILSQEEERGLRLRLLLEEGANVLLQRLFTEIGVTAAGFDAFLQTKKTKLSKLIASPKSSYSSTHHSQLFPGAGTSFDITKMDIPLTYILYRNITSLPGPWGPRALPGTLQEKIEHLRYLRNETLHRTLPLSYTDFVCRWNDLYNVIKDLGGDAVRMNRLKTIGLDNSIIKRLSAAEQRVKIFEDGLKSTHHGVPKIIPNFAGRKGEVDEICRLFEQGNEVVVLCGEGGVGKTEIALKYIEVHRTNLHGNNIVWIDAENINALKMSFTDFATRLELVDINETLQKMIEKSYLFYSGNSSQILFVFDNADDAVLNRRIMKEFLPVNCAPYVKVLITSRVREWIEYGYYALNIEVFPRETAEKFIEHELGNVKPSINIEVIPLIVEKLSFLPLALQQCAAYIKRNHITVEKYIERYDSQFDALFKREVPKYGRTVMQCLNVTIDALDANALRILYTVSVLDSCQVHQALLEYLPDFTETLLSESIAEITTRSLIKHDGTFLTMHSLSRTVIRINLEQRGLIGRYLKTASKLISEAVAADENPEQHYDYGAIWLNHVSAISKETDSENWTLMLPLIDLIDKIYAAFENRKMLADALAFLRKSRHMYLSKEQSAEVSQISQRLEIYIYHALMVQEKYEEAIGCFREYNLLTNCNDVPLGHAHDFDLVGLYETQRSEYMYATYILHCDNLQNGWSLLPSRLFQDWYNRMYTKPDNIEESKLLVRYEMIAKLYNGNSYEEVSDKFNTLKDDYIEVFGNDHELTIDLLHTIAYCRMDEGKINPEDWEKLCEHSSNAVGPSHVLTHDSKEQYGLSLFAERRYEEAKKVFGNLYNQQRTSLGVRHEKAIRTQSYLRCCLQQLVQTDGILVSGYLLEDQIDDDYVKIDSYLYDSSKGNKMSAEKELQQIAEAQRKTLDDGYNEILTAKSTVCDTLFQQQKFELACDEAQKLLMIQVDYLGQDHKNTLKTLFRYSRCFYKLEKYEESKREFQKLYSLQLKSLGDSDKDTMHTLHWVSRCLYELKQYEQAKHKFEEVYDLERSNLGETHENTFNSLYWLARSCYNLEQYEEARRKLQKLHSLQLKSLGENDKDTMHTLYLLSRCFYEEEKYEDAKREFEKVYHFECSALGENDEDTICTLYWLARCFYDLEQYEDAKREFQKLQSLKLNSLGEDHLDRLHALLWISRCLYKLKQHQNAKSAFDNLHNLQCQFLGENAEDSLMSWHWAATCKYKLGHYEECKKNLKTIYHKKVEVFGEDHESTLETRFWRAKCFYRLHKYKAAHNEFENTYAQRVELLGKGAEYTISTLYWYSICLYQLRQFERSRQQFEEVHEARLKYFGEDHKNTISAFYWMARCNYSLGDYSTSRDRFERVLKLQLNLYAETHEWITDTKCWIGRCMYHLEDYESSYLMFEKTYNDQRTFVSSEHVDVVNTSLWMTRCLERVYADWELI